MPDDTVLGQSYARVDAVDKVTGRVQYASDVYLPGMLMGKVLTSTRPHARILRIDTARAEKLPGVRAVITGQEVPDVRFGNGAVKDRRIFARDKVRYIGEPVAAVAAVDELTALEALDLIEVTYEDLAAVTDPIAALKPDAPLVHEDLPTYDGFAPSMRGNICTVLTSDRGDVDAAFAQADHVFEDTFRSQGIHQGYLEAMACLAHVDPSGRIHVWTSTQGPYQVRATLAAVLARPIAHLRIIPMELGGGFGAKLRLCLEAYPVLLALKTGKTHCHAGGDVYALRLSSPDYHLFKDRSAAGWHHRGPRGAQCLRYGGLPWGRGAIRGEPYPGTLQHPQLPGALVRRLYQQDLGWILPRLGRGRRHLCRGVPYGYHCAPTRP
jgi:CO/xanthine dehydrogenase Mo-binding subunit